MQSPIVNLNILTQWLLQHYSPPHQPSTCLQTFCSSTADAITNCEFEYPDTVIVSTLLSFLRRFIAKRDPTKFILSWMNENSDTKIHSRTPSRPKPTPGPTHVLGLYPVYCSNLVHYCNANKAVLCFKKVRNSSLRLVLHRLTGWVSLLMCAIKSCEPSYFSLHTGSGWLEVAHLKRNITWFSTKTQKFADKQMCICM